MGLIGFFLLVLILIYLVITFNNITAQIRWFRHYLDILYWTFQFLHLIHHISDRHYMPILYHLLNRLWILALIIIHRVKFIFLLHQSFIAFLYFKSAIYVALARGQVFIIFHNELLSVVAFVDVAHKLFIEIGLRYPVDSFILKSYENILVCESWKVGVTFVVV